MAVHRNIISKGKKLFNTTVSAILNSKAVKYFAQRNPKSYHFILERFSLDKFTGLPLSFLVLAFIANLFVLNELIETFVNSEPMILLDQTFAQFLFKIRIHVVALAFFYFSKLGSLVYVVIIALLVTAVYYIKKKYAYLLPLWVALAGVQLTVTLGKNHFHRLRPADLGFYYEPAYSFPSGHATVAVAFYGMVFYSIIRHKKKYSSKLRWLIAGLVFIALLGFSRLYLGVHYMTDVFAGFSLGFSWLLLAISITEWNMHRKLNKRSSEVVPRMPG